MKRLLTLFAVALFALSATAQNVQIDGAGATFPNPIYTKWFSEYGKLHPNVRINYQSIGSGGGTRQLSAGTGLFGATDGPLTHRPIAAARFPTTHPPPCPRGTAPVSHTTGRT